MLLLILLGVGLIAGGILVMAGAGPELFASPITGKISSVDWEGVFVRRFGSFLFSVG